MYHLIALTREFAYISAHSVRACTAAVAKTLVSMEQSYVSAAFFRHLTKERLQRHQAEQLLADGKLMSCELQCMRCNTHLHIGCPPMK